MDSLGQHHSGSMFVSSLLHYPSVTTRMLRSGESIRNPAHSDLSTLTFLFQQDVGGLQVAYMTSTDKTTSAAVNKSATFLNVEPHSDLVLVNAGYLLMRWTNGRWKSVVHRVSFDCGKSMEGQSPESVPERYSIAFFSFPDPETSIEPLGTCCTIEVPKKWGPLNAGEYLRRKRGVLYQ